MGKLSNSLIYLAGPIENVKDDGVHWRREIIAKAEPLGIKFLDPTNKPSKFKPEIGTEKQHLQVLRQQGRYEDVREYVKGFRREDLRFVDISDAIILYIDPDIHTCGSYNEIFVAEDQCKPRFLIVKGGKAVCPVWLFSVFHVCDIFDSVDECVQRLKDIDNGVHATSREWVLIRDCI